QAAAFGVRLQQLSHRGAEFRIAGAGAVEECVPGLRPAVFQGGEKDVAGFAEVGSHGTSLDTLSARNAPSVSQKFLELQRKRESPPSSQRSQARMNAQSR